MKKMNKKGFTLVELLTVIAILAIILLIAAPTILNVLEKAKKNIFKSQVLMYVESLKTQIALSSVGTADMVITWTEQEVDGNTVSVAEVDVTKIPMDSDQLTSGTIIVTPQGNGRYVYEIVNVTDGKYTANAKDATKMDESSIQPYKAPATPDTEA